MRVEILPVTPLGLSSIPNSNPESSLSPSTNRRCSCSRVGWVQETLRWTVFSRILPLFFLCPMLLPCVMRVRNPFNR